MDLRVNFLSQCISILTITCALKVKAAEEKSLPVVRGGTVADSDGGERRVIYYGTSDKYCGQVGGTEKRNKVGTSKHVDACCKEQSACALKIHKDKQRWGVKNVLGFTISDCECEDKFSACLKGVKKHGAEKDEQDLAVSVRSMYFDILATPCVILTKQADEAEKEIGISEKSEGGNGSPKAYMRMNQGRSSHFDSIDSRWSGFGGKSWGG